MYYSEWEFNLKGTHCVCSWALTVIKNLGIILKIRRVLLLFRTQLHFSSVFFHLNRQSTALGLAQPSQRLGLLKILYSDKICANQELGMWETYFLPPLAGKLWKPLSLVCPSDFGKHLTRSAVPVNPRGSTFGIPHTGLRIGVKGGGQGRVWGGSREGDCGGKDGSRVRPGRNVWVSLWRGQRH